MLPLGRVDRAGKEARPTPSGRDGGPVDQRPDSMARITFLQIVRRCTPEDSGPVFEQQLGQLSAALRLRGHQTALLRLSQFDRHALHRALDAHEPDLVHVVFDGVSLDSARRTLTEISERCNLPVSVGGPTATVMPDLALSLPGVRAVLLGEADHTLPACLDAVLGGGTIDVEGVWTNDAGRINKNGIAAMVTQLDDLPFPDRALFGATAASESFDITVGRGCPFRCAYCLNDPLRSAAEAGAAFVRRRSPENVCREIDELCMNYPETRRLRFTDHAFALDADWLASFVAAYESGCGIPFSCHVRANGLDERRADLLRRAGCIMAEVEVISGSDFVRNDALEMDTSDEQIERTFALLRERDIATHSVCFVGAPRSTPMAEVKTLELSRRLNPRFVEVRVYYPYEGTAARELCRDEGWLSNRGEAGYTFGESVLDLPQLPPRKIKEFAEQLSDDIAGPAPSPLLRFAEWLRGGTWRLFAEAAAAVRRRPAGVMRSRRR